jgi:hypothetical protein
MNALLKVPAEISANYTVANVFIKWLADPRADSQEKVADYRYIKLSTLICDNYLKPND